MLDNLCQVRVHRPETEQHRRYMQGFHDDTERRLKAGITATEPRGETLAKAREENSAVH